MGLLAFLSKINCPVYIIVLSLIIILPGPVLILSELSHFKYKYKMQLINQ